MSRERATGSIVAIAASRAERPVSRFSLFAASMMLCVLASSPQESWARREKIPFLATAILIELTEDDIELQAFIDGTKWKTTSIFDPSGKQIFSVNARGRRLGKQGLSEVGIASHPSHFLEEEPEFDEPIEDFLARFPEGEYRFKGKGVDGNRLEGSAMLTHVFAALPEIIAPVSDTDEPPLVDRNDLVIEWEPVTTRFIGEGPVEIVEYQVILDPLLPRTMPWVDGNSRRALINIPGSMTRLTVPPEYLEPAAEYNFEILAIESSGNSSIAVGSFVTTP